MKKIICLFLILIFVSPSLILAADKAETETQDDKGQEDETTKELEAISAPGLTDDMPEPIKKKLIIKRGGWFSSTLRKYRNTDNDNGNTDNLKSSWQNDLRLWMWMTYLKKYTLYFMFRNTDIDRNTGTGYTGIGDDNEGPYLDMGYVSGNINIKNIKIGAKLGRQFFSIGRGIAFSGVHDGIELNVRPKNLYIKSIFALSNPKDNNLDQSVPEYDKKEDRFYAGLEASFTRFYPIIFYLYGIAQRDMQDNHPGLTAQRFQYHSQYVGIGLDKQVRRGLSYWVEFIKEWGRTYNDSSYVAPTRCKIDAWAIDTGARYILNMPMNPTIECEYALGSGDPDRTDVVDTDPGGNQYGNDNNFSYYGYFGTGYALAGRLSNLELLKVQVGFTPLEKMKFAKDIDMGIKFFLYRKHRARGAIYDTQASQAHNDVGKEINLFAYWEPNDKFYMNFRFGVFYPGAAFPETTNDNTRYFLTRATFKF